MMAPMKYIFLAIFVLIAAQPVQATWCNVNDAQQCSQHGSHDRDHGDGQNMDCCDHDPGMPSDQCNAALHCGAHSLGFMAFNTIAINVILQMGDCLDRPDNGEPPSNFIPPPFKPPIV